VKTRKTVKIVPYGLISAKKYHSYPCILRETSALS